MSEKDTPLVAGSLTGNEEATNQTQKPERPSQSTAVTQDQPDQDPDLTELKTNEIVLKHGMKQLFTSLSCKKHTHS